MSGKTAPFAPLKTKGMKFHLRDVAAALVRMADLHEGLWQVQIIFGNAAANMNLNGAFVPSAITSVVALQLARVEALDPLTVDAAAVNPSKRIILAAGSSAAN